MLIITQIWMLWGYFPVILEYHLKKLDTTLMGLHRKNYVKPDFDVAETIGIDCSLNKEKGAHIENLKFK
jgi:hypothetical protein